MDHDLNDHGLPIGEYMRRCQMRIEEINRSIAELTQEKDRLTQMVTAYGALRSASSSSSPKRHTIVWAHEQDESAGSTTRGRSQVLMGGGLAAGWMERSRNERILATVATLLSDRRWKTGDLVQMLDYLGVGLTSANPIGLLSTLMSKDGRFTASRKHGWGLAGRDDEDPEDEE
jgi:hypothetical protein